MTPKGVGLVKEIRIENVRSLKDTGWIPLKPVTLLVGQNSAGKSTFLRTFPLLKQSIRKRTDGPLLWVRDVDDYVDFGSFAETVNKGVDKNHRHIRFSFKFPAEPIGLKVGSRNTQQGIKDEQDIKDEDIEYSIEIKSLHGSDYVSHLYVRILKSTFEFDFPPSPPRSFDSDLDEENMNPDSAGVNSDTGSVKVNGCEIPLNPAASDAPKRSAETGFPIAPEAVRRRRKSVFGFFLPSIELLKHDMQRRYDFSQEEPYSYDDGNYLRRYEFSSFFDMAQRIGYELCRGASAEDVFSKRPSHYQRMEGAFSKIYYIHQHMSEEEKDRDLLIFQLFFLYDVFRQFEEYLRFYYQQVHYVAPVRATAERYYRLNNVSIDEVDFQGVNVPQFLAGMDKDNRRNFQKWTREHFGVRFFTENLKGVYTSLKISAEENGNSVNLADTGFGYSQILPIIIQLWEFSTRKRTSMSERWHLPLVIAIEQPELHLHPELQAKLVRALIAAIDRAKKNGRSLQLLLETHSETIVNSFGLAIADGKLSPDDVSAVLFDRTIGESDSSVRSVRFTKEGYLEDWPVGFFVPNEE